ncbi:Hint domain-containing protein [Streptomyces sp. NRRL F-5126]|uniref:Hint domain-containing protein n=1 Tax=Streptomyces sp. NRRL F-5126 TaxID=1463857 RepID=UPI00056CA5BE|nr:Hint domain-containing protein [Streptomyces sp. NRRL F-5126]
MRTRALSGRRRALSRWPSLLLGGTALLATITTTASGSGLAPLTPRLSTVADAPTVDGGADAPFDLDAAQKIRDAQCLLGAVLRKGGPAMKKVARAGLDGTDDQLLAAAAPDYWDGTPLDVAFEKDRAWSTAKGDELSGRNDAWQASLDVTQEPPGYTYTGFRWPPSDPDLWVQTGVRTWVEDRFWQDEDAFYDDQSPLASKDSVDAVTKIATTRYSENKPEDYEDWSAWTFDMQLMHPMYADDARIFLENGGFPTTAPEPGSMGFRVDVENLKSRFASCTTTNPQDPHHVLTDELTVAAQEWQAEIKGQRDQRDAILAAEQQASADLQVAAQAMTESLGQSLITSRLTDWQNYFLKLPADDLDHPTKAEADQVNTWIAQARARASGRMFVASRAALDARKQADKVTAAQNAAYAIADQAGLPRGRGLLYGQQAAQVTKASAAAAQAASQATDTAVQATRASASDSKALNSLAQTQAHATKAEFRREAAEEAQAQAKAAALGAAEQAKQAAANATTAKNAQAKAEDAEATAKNAAADAKAKRQTAESERDTAKAQKELADSERAKAADAESRAKSQRQVAADKLAAAQSAGATAAARKDDAVAAESKAVAARDKAIDAESDRDVALARASAAEAKADADEGTSAASASRAAATQARADADAATAAATSARSAANEATTAATNARAAATRAQGAAKRAQAAADAAKADVAVTEVAVTKAHAAAAEAIDASETAKWNAANAKALASEAQAKAAKAKVDAAASQKEAVAAGADAVRTAGYAYATAQAATAARDSAAQVVKPANDAIELGAPYAQTDASAGLAVLTGQAAKTQAQKQQAVAQAKSAQAKQAAAEAKALADKAGADAKAAATAAASAADWASQAVQSSQDAQASAKQAETAADAAKKAETQTVAYNTAAVADANAAQGAATTAAGYADQADASATAAETDASSARDAATAAETDASTARGVADQAEADATTAEAAAANAQQAAQEAQDAATRAEQAAANDTLNKGGATGIGQMFTKQKITPIGNPKPLNDCVLGMGNSGCDVTFRLNFTLTVDFYLCTSDSASDVPAASCPAESIVFLGSQTSDETTDIKKHFSNWDISMIVDKAFLKGLWDGLTEDFIKCSKGSLNNCAWAASWFIPNTTIAKAVDLVRSLDVALRTGVGVGDAYKALQALHLDAEVMANIEREMHRVEEGLTSCVNSFPAGTQVLMADGSKRAIKALGPGDEILATDPATGQQHAEPITAAFNHLADHLVTVTLTDGAHFTSTPGHRIYSPGRGWTLAGDLAPGERLRAPNGSLRIVSTVRGVAITTPHRVYDLTVANLHTYYVLAGPEPVLVHNAGICGVTALKQGDWQHILDRHRPGGSLVDDASSIFTGKEKVVRQRIADTINRGTPKPNTPDPVTGTPRPGQIYEWDFGVTVGVAGPVNGGGELKSIRVIVNEGKVVTAFPF